MIRWGKPVEIRWRQKFLLAITSLVFGAGLFFSLFVIFIMSHNASVSIMYILLLPAAMIIYGVIQLDKIDQFLKTTHEAWRR